MFRICLGQSWEQLLPIYVVHIFHHQTMVSPRRIPYDIHEGHDVGSTRQVPKHFYLSFDFLCSDRFQHLDNTRLVILYIYSLENLYHSLRIILQARGLN